MENKKTQVDGTKVFMTIIFVVVTALLFLGIGFVWGQQAGEVNQNEALSGTSATAQATLSATASVDTSNWKTYTDKTYGFLIRYPNDWELDQSALSFLPKRIGEENRLNSPDTPGQFDWEVRIDITDLTKEGKTYMQYIDEAVDAGRFENLRDITFNGIQAKSGSLTPITKKSLIIFNRGNYVFELSQPTKEETKLSASEQQTGNQILSTFKFIK